MKSRHHAAPRRAFTLIESMIALAIFVMMAVVLGSAYVGTLNSYDMANKVQYEDEDVRFARVLVLAKAKKDDVEQGGEFENASHNRVRWQATITPTETTDVFSVILKCSVTAADAKAPSEIEQTFRVLRPTWSEKVDHDKLRALAKERITELQLKKGNS